MVMLVDMKVFYTFNMSDNIKHGLVVDNTVDGKDNKEEKTREVVYIRMYHFGWNFQSFLYFQYHHCLNI